jgi:ferredoxin--NADP+ reductase
MFSIRPDGGKKLEYRAGQFAVLGLPADPENPDGQWIRRAYSIVSAPGASDVEFYVVLVETGALTPRLWKLKKGDGVFMGEKAAGLVDFSGVEDTSDVLFVAAGTGIAPFISMLRGNRAGILNGMRRVSLVHGARHTYELGFKAELEDIQRQSPYFRYYPVVSRSHEETGAEWKGHKGHVQSLISGGVLERDFGKKITPEGFHVFLCGHARMVDECAGLFAGMGFVKNTPQSKGNLHFDKH